MQVQSQNTAAAAAEFQQEVSLTERLA